MISTVRIRQLTPDDLPAIARTDGGAAWHGDPSLWNAYLEEVTNDSRVVLVAVAEEEIVGYGSLILRSKYSRFADALVPEISNLVVAEAWRRQGTATALISEFEAEARARGFFEVGIGFGLYDDYGPAQRLYVKLGYVPDGRGITYRWIPVVPGDLQPVDDDLVLWLTKPLKAVHKR